MAVHIQFTVSDELHSQMFETAKEHNMSVSQYARIVFLANRYMSSAAVANAMRADLDRREQERRDRDEIRRNPNRGVRRVDGGGYGRS